MNQQIRSPKILLIDGEEKVGVINTEEAIQRAREKELDLVEVAPLSDPPVCKIMDFGNYLYDLRKKEKKARKTVKKTETKTVRLSIRTEKHDLEVKAKQAKKFLEGRNIVKVVLIFRGREISHQDLAMEKMQAFYQILEDICKVEQEPKRQGFQMTMILNPNK
ncbi:translation initiation factor IF-3 [Patescibacteria group bacterium]|nr:translation initiation factor IF-3 [Patescibacteria group bacterium]